MHEYAIFVGRVSVCSSSRYSHALPIHPKILSNGSLIESTEAIESGVSEISMDRSDRIGRFGIADSSEDIISNRPKRSGDLAAAVSVLVGHHRST